MPVGTLYRCRVSGVYDKVQGSSGMPPKIFSSDWKAANERKVNTIMTKLIAKYGSLDKVPEEHMPRPVPGTLPTKVKQEEEASNEPAEGSDDDNSWGTWTGGAREPVAGPQAGPVACGSASGTTPSFQQQPFAAPLVKKPESAKQPWGPRGPWRKEVQPQLEQLEPEAEAANTAAAEAAALAARRSDNRKGSSTSWKGSSTSWKGSSSTQWERKADWEWKQWEWEQEGQQGDDKKWESNVKQEQHWQEPARPADAAAGAPIAPWVKQKPEQAADAAGGKPIQPSVKKKKKQEQPEPKAAGFESPNVRLEKPAKKVVQRLASGMLRIRPNLADANAKAAADAAALRKLAAEKKAAAAAAALQNEAEAKQCNLEHGAPPGATITASAARKAITRQKANNADNLQAGALALQGATAAKQLGEQAMGLGLLDDKRPVSNSPGRSRSRSPCDKRQTLRQTVRTPSPDPMEPTLAQPTLSPEQAKPPTGPPPFHLRIKRIVGLRVNGDKDGAEKEYAAVLKTIGQKKAEDCSEWELILYMKSIVPGSRDYWDQQQSESQTSQTVTGP